MFKTAQSTSSIAWFFVFSIPALAWLPKKLTGLRPSLLFPTVLATWIKMKSVDRSNCPQVSPQVSTQVSRFRPQVSQ